MLQRFQIIAGVFAIALVLAGAWYFSARPSADVTLQTGQIFTSSGNSQGGLIATNIATQSPVINYTANTFNNASFAPDGHYISFHPSLSKNGKIAFLSNRLNPRHRVFSMDLDGTNRKQLTTSANSVYPDDQTRDENPVISPDGKTVLFISNRDDELLNPNDVFSGKGFTDIFTVNAEGGNLKRITQQSFKDLNNKTQNYIADWHPNGTKIAFVGVREVPDGRGGICFCQVVGTINPDGTDEKILVRGYPRGSFLSHNVLDWSVAGILYATTDANGTVTGYNILNPDTGATTTWTPKLFVDGNPRFSPDGQFIVASAANSSDIDAEWRPTVFDLKGNVVLRTPIVHSRGMPVWWFGGKSIPEPKSLVLMPQTLKLVDGFSDVIVPELRDSQGNVIVKVATDWKLDQLTPGERITVDTLGNIDSNGKNNRLLTTFRLTASNGGLKGSATIQLYNLELLKAENNRLKEALNKLRTAYITQKRYTDNLRKGVKKLRSTFTTQKRYTDNLRNAVRSLRAQSSLNINPKQNLFSSIHDDSVNILISAQASKSIIDEFEVLLSKNSALKIAIRKLRTAYITQKRYTDNLRKGVKKLRSAFTTQKRYTDNLRNAVKALRNR